MAANLPEDPTSTETNPEVALPPPRESFDDETTNLAPKTPAASVANSKEESFWDNEKEVLFVEAAAVSERDPRRGAVLHGAVAQLAYTVLADRRTRGLELESASRISRERWISSLSRREALIDGEHAPALQIARDELQQIGDGIERVALLVELALLALRVDEDEKAARASLEEAREIDPSSALVLAPLAELYLDGGDDSRHVNALQAMADTTVDVEIRSALRLGAGDVHDLRLHSGAAARAAWKLALADDPRNIAAAGSLESLAVREGDFAELAAALLLEAELVNEPRTVRRTCERAGDIFWEKLHDVERAIAAYTRAAKATPQERAPLIKLAAVLESSGRWRELVDVHQKELPLTAHPMARAELYFRIAEIHRSRLGHAREAEDAYLAALDCVPRHAPSLEALAALYRASERWAELAQLIQREADRAPTNQKRAELLLDVADLVEQKLGHQGEARRLLERAYELLPGQRAAFAGLDRLYRREAAWAELVKLYEAHAKVVKDPVLVRVLRQAAGKLWQVEVPNAERAAAAFKDAHKIDAEDLAPLWQMTQVLEAVEKSPQLAEVLAELAGRLSDPLDKLWTLDRLAKVVERLGEIDRVIQIHEQALAIDPAHERSLRALARLHRQRGTFTEVIKIHERELAVETNDESKAALQCRIGRIQETELGKRTEAIAAFQRALGHLPSFEPARRALERLLRRDGMCAELIALHRLSESVAIDNIDKARLEAEMGTLEELHRGDLDAAQSHYVAALELAPSLEAAVAALAHVSERRGDWVTLASHLQWLLEQTDEPNARALLLGRLGAVWEFRRDEPARAAPLYVEALDSGSLGGGMLYSALRATAAGLGPAATVPLYSRLGAKSSDIRLAHGARALAALIAELYDAGDETALYAEAARLGQGDPLVIDGVIRAMIRHQEVGPQLAPVLVERARLANHQLLRALLLLEAAYLWHAAGDAANAEPIYAEAARAFPELLPTLRGLRHLAVARGDWPQAVTLLAREAESAAVPVNREAALLQAGEIATSKLHEPQRALQHYRRLLELDPHHERAFFRARAILEKLRDHQGLLSLLGARIAATTKPEERADLLKQQAALLRDALQDPRGAVAALKQAVSLTPDDVDAWVMLAPLEEAAGWWQDAAECHRRVADLTAGTHDGRAARLREASIRERELGDLEAARQILEELVVDDEDREAGRVMARLAHRMGNLERAKELWTRLCKSAPTIAERANNLFELSRVLSAASDRSFSRVLDEAFTFAAADAEAVKVLEERFSASNDWAGFVAAAERVLKARPPNANQNPLRAAVARAYSESLDRPDLALAHIAQARQLAPDDPLLASRAGQLELHVGRLELALDSFRRALNADPFGDAPLRGLAEVLRGAPGYARHFTTLAEVVAGAPPTVRPSPQKVRRPLDANELQSLAPALHDEASLAIEHAVRQLEPTRDLLLTEALGRGPAGSELPVDHPVTTAVWDVARALSIDPLPRVFADNADMPTCALASNGRLGINVGRRLGQASEEPRLIFESARCLVPVAVGTSFSAVLRAPELGALLSAIVQEGGNDEQLELRRRVLKPLQRKQRKEIERVLADGRLNMNAVNAWHMNEWRRALRIALLLSGDIHAALWAITGNVERLTLQMSARAGELVRWLATEPAFRLHQRFIHA